MCPRVDVIGNTVRPVSGAGGITPEGLRRLKTAPSAAQGEIDRTDAWRHERVSVAAYYLAQRRGFRPGNEAEDWTLAELQTDAIDEAVS